MTEISKYMSYLLRHNPSDLPSGVDVHGWAMVNELITLIRVRFKSMFSFNDLKMIVDNDSKSRYSFNYNKTMIRANQGHSIDVDVELDEIEPPIILYHGTAEKYVHSIMKEGLISKQRLYVHLTNEVENAAEIGKRHGVPVVIIIDSKKMHKDGFKFYLSKNGVYLTKQVPLEYIKGVI